MAQQTPAQDPRAAEHYRAVQRVKTEIGRVIVGQDAMVNRLLIALLTNSHALIEGVPGLAKTLTVSHPRPPHFAARSPASSSRPTCSPPTSRARWSSARRMPSSTSAEDRSSPTWCSRTRSTERRPRCSPRCWRRCRNARSRSAESRCRCPSHSWCWRRRTRSSHEGTYPLPEAQLDRFMLKVLVDYPDRDEERDILGRGLEGGEEAVQAVTGPEEVAELRDAVHPRRRERPAARVRGAAD